MLTQFKTTSGPCFGKALANASEHTASTVAIPCTWKWPLIASMCSPARHVRSSNRTRGASTWVQLHACTQAKVKACCANEEPFSNSDPSAYNLMSSSLFQLGEGK